MRAEKRLWIYSGLSVPDGVGLTQRATRQNKNFVGSVLVIGNDTSKIRGLLAPLSRLVGSGGGKVVFDLKQKAKPENWVQNKLFTRLLKQVSPTHVLIALDPRNNSKSQLDKSIRIKSPAKIIWLPDAGIFTLNSIAAPHKVDAKTLAEWAARIWAHL